MPIPVGFAEVSYVHSIPGSTRPLINVWGHEYAPEFGPGETYPQQLWDFWVARIMLCINNDIRLQEVVARIGSADGSPIIESFAAGDSNGTLPGEALPNNCATLVKKNTTLGGRKGRGRCYLPPVGEESSGGGRLDPSTVSFIQGSFNAWLADVAGAGFGAVLLHDGPGNPVAPTPVTSVSVDPLLATQRRRLR